MVLIRISKRNACFRFVFAPSFEVAYNVPEEAEEVRDVKDYQNELDCLEEEVKHNHFGNIIVVFRCILSQYFVILDNIINLFLVKVLQFLHDSRHIEYLDSSIQTYNLDYEE